MHILSEGPDLEQILIPGNARDGAVWGKYPDSGQTMDLTEIEILKAKDVIFWLTDNKGQYYFQDKDDVWRVEKGSYQGGHFVLYDGRKYELLERDKARPMELHLTRIIN